jgi:two-component system CheB/CheR fusion protein
MPLLENGGAPLGAKILYCDITRFRSLQDDKAHVKQELETTREELQTTNEELQSTIEELETTNEELQSTNEELETMNEELQSTNEELRTMNDELIRRGEELNDVNSFLESILGSLEAGVTVLNNDLQVQVWNRHAEDLWGLRSEEVAGKNFLNLDIGLPVDRLKQPIRTCLNGDGDHQQLLLDATNRRGKPIQCEVTCTPLFGASKQVQGVIVLMEGKDNL